VFRTFDIVAKYVVECDFQGADAGAFGLSLQELFQVFLSRTRNAAQFVQFFGDTCCNAIAFVEVDRGVFKQRVFDGSANCGTALQLGSKIFQAGVVAVFGQFFDGQNGFQRVFEYDHFTG
jgi:hypothetical protein